MFRNQDRPLRLAFAVALAALSGPSQADVKIEATVNITGLPYPNASVPYPRHLTSFIRLDKAVVMVQGGPTTIYDNTAKSVTTVNPLPKTYCIQTRDQKLAEGSPTGQMADLLKPDARVDVKPTKLTRIIAGQPSTKYTVKGTLTMSLKGGGIGPGGGMRGGPRGAGGFPGAMPFQMGGPGRMELPRVTMAGEIWLADTPPAPWTRKDKHAALSLAASLLPATPLIKPLAEALSKLHAFPVAADLTLTLPSSRASSRPTVSIVMEVLSIGDSMVDDSAYTPPNDYVRADPQPAEPLISLPEGRMGSNRPG